MASRKSSTSRQARYAAQYARTEANKKRKIKKHAKHNPNDQQAAAKVAALA
jgi:hypothetical protein